MKRILQFTLVLVVLIAARLSAQNPYGFYSSGTVRDAIGKPMANSLLKLRFSFMKIVASNPAFYQESHNVTTDGIGNYTTIISRGVATIGQYNAADFDYSNGKLWVKTEMLNSSGIWVELTTSELLLPVGVPGRQGDKGNTGSTGKDGISPNLTIGNVKQSTTAAASISGIFPNLKLDLNIPKGDTGFLQPGSAKGNTAFWDGAKWITNTSVFFNDGKRLGAFTNTPLAPIHIKDSQFLISSSFPVVGSKTSGITTNGSYFTFLPEKAALKSGAISNSNAWNKDSIGLYSASFGLNTQAKGTYSLSLGVGTISNGNSSFAQGNGSKGLSDNSIAMGWFATSTGSNAVAIGRFAKATGWGSIALGVGNETKGDGASSVGTSNYSIGYNSGTFGTQNYAYAASSYAIGIANKSFEESSISMGYGSRTFGAYSIAIGQYCQANGLSSVAVGISNDTIISPQKNTLLNNTPIFTVGVGDLTGARKNGLMVRKDGRIAFGNLVPAYSYEFQYSDVAKPGSNSFTVTSDSNLKTNVSGFTNGLNTVLKMNPKIYNYTAKMGLPTTEQYIGLFAQELQRVAPYMVKTWKRDDARGDTSTYLGVDYGAMDFLLLNSVKDLNTKVEEQNRQINELKQSNILLLKRLEAVEKITNK